MATLEATARPRRATRPSVRLLEAEDAPEAVEGAPGAVRPLSTTVTLSAASPLAAQAAVGRRLRVYWPDEGDWFFGIVASYESSTGFHTVHYDDGDIEAISLAPAAGERFEWVTEPRATSELDGTACGAEGQRLVRQTESLGGDRGAWPQVGDLLWGRIKVRCLRRLASACRLTRRRTGTRVVARPGCGAVRAASSSCSCVRRLFRQHLRLGLARRLPAVCREFRSAA